MSATIDTDIFVRYFNNCPVISVPGRTHPVQVFHLEHILKATNFRIRPAGQTNNWKKNKQSRLLDEKYKRLMGPSIKRIEKDKSFPSHVASSLWNRKSEDADPELVLKVLEHITTLGDGAVLIFYPGKVLFKLCVS